MALRLKDTACTTQIVNESSIFEMFNESDVGVEKEKTSSKRNSMELDDLSEEEIVSEPEVEPEQEPVLQRSIRERRPPNHYEEWASVATGTQKEPGTG